MPTAFFYPSGEPIRAGDRIEYAGSRGHVEFVTGGGPQPPDAEWLVKTHGPGFMIWTEATGSLYLSNVDEDLRLIRESTSDRAAGQ